MEAYVRVFMSDILIDSQSPPVTPSSGQLVLYSSSSSKKFSTKNDSGVVNTLERLTNFSVAGPTGFSTDTYLTGSSISLLDVLPRVGTLYYCAFDVTKTAAGTAAPTITLRYGTLGTTGDAAIMSFPFSAQTAAIDTGMFEVWAMFRAVGPSAFMQGRARLSHGLSVTGLGTQVSQVSQISSGLFSSGVSNSIVGLSVNGGASAAWTINFVNSELNNI